jgi:hypothetical protein
MGVYKIAGRSVRLVNDTLSIDNDEPIPIKKVGLSHFDLK